jgi:predicted DNA-binding transcriptional regulator YafY
MSRSFHLDVPGWFQHFDRPPHLATVTDAVLAQCRIRVLYNSWERESTKMLDPYGLVQKGGRWYLVAVSTNRASRPSTYRVDQIADISVLDETFTRPNDFDLASYWNESLRSFRERLRTGTAIVKLTQRGLEHYRDLTSEPAEVTGPEVDGWVTATIPIESIGDARSVLWRLRAEVVVLEPLELRSLMADAARELADLYRLTA